MDIFILYLKVFLVGGFICMIGQLLIIKTNLTSARILVLFVCIGAVMEAIGLYEPLIQFASAGAIVPITGFGRSLAKGVIDAIKEKGLLGVLTGGLTATAGGIAASVIFAYIFALLFSSKTKKY
jgi:stage V sporulation protein AE